MKKRNIVLALFVGMTLASCNEPSVSEPSTSVSNSTSVEAPSISTSTSEISVENYYDIFVENGTGSQTHVLEGTQITVEANEPEEGFEFDCWKDENGTTVSNDSSYAFEVTKITTLTANFKRLKFNVVVTGGSGSGEYEYGDQVSVSATVEDTHEFVKWVDENGDEVSTSNPYVFEITSDKTLIAETKEKFIVPDSLDTFKTVLAKSAKVQVNTASIAYAKQDNKYTSSYSTNICNETITMYDNALVIDGSEKSYSEYKYNKVVVIDNGKLKEVKKYATSYPTSTAVAYSLVDEVTNSSSQMTNEHAYAYVNSYNLIEEITSALNEVSTSKTLDEFNCTKVNNQYEILIKAYSKDSLKYYTTEINVSMDENYFISSYTFKGASYVIATQCDADGNLKEDAVANGTLSLIYDVTYGDTKNVAPADKVDMSMYFISDFEIKGRYYENNVSREFNESNPFIVKDASIRASDVEMVTNSIQPSTYLEKKNLTLVSVSNEAVLNIEKDSSGNPSYLKAVGVGTSTLVVATSAGVEKSITLEVKNELPPVSLEVDCNDKVLVNEMIELNVKNLRPVSADARVEWSVDNSALAEIVKQDDKTYLKGLTTGFVNVTVTSIADSAVFASKSIFVSAGELSNEDLSKVVVGKWLGGSSETNGFIFEFKNDGTVTVTDNYRYSNKINLTGRWALTDTLDGDLTHRGTNVKENVATYKVIEVTDIVLGGGASDAPYVEIHFVIDTDGSKMNCHYAAPSSSSSHIVVEMAKQKVNLTNVVAGTYTYSREFDTDLDGEIDDISTFTFKFNNDGTFELIDEYRRVNKIDCTGNWSITEDLDETKTHNDASDDTVLENLEVTKQFKTIVINNLVISSEEGHSAYLDIHFALSEDGTQIIAHIRVSETAKTLIYELNKVE